MSSSNVNRSKSKVNADTSVDENRGTITTSDKRYKNQTLDVTTASKKSSPPPSYESNSNERSSKQKRPSSLFRIKTGCMVALRFQTGGNNVDVCRQTRTLKRKLDEIATSKIQTINLDDEDTIQVWVDPIAGRDERYALIGNRIRCFFPQSNNNKKSKRTLEGEVIRWVDDGISDKSNLPAYEVELLIDKSNLEYFPFLNRIDDEIDISKLPNEKARKNYLLEESIRGRNKATVQVTLENPRTLGTSSSNDRLRWVVLKRIQHSQFTKEGKVNTGKRSNNDNLLESTNENDSNDRGMGESGKQGALSSSETPKSKNKQNRQNSSNEKSNGSTKATTSATVSNVRYCGDGNDSAEQQISNWRWLSSHYPDISYISSSSNFRPRADYYDSNLAALLKKAIIAGGLLGVVVSVNASTPKSDDSSLALVTIRRYILPEHTMSGRLPNHRRSEIFESFDDNFQDDGDVHQIEFRIPIEQLIIIEPSAPAIEHDSEPNFKSFFLQYSYSAINNTYTSILSYDVSVVDEISRSPTTFPSSAEYCHRCRTSANDLERCTNEKYCLVHSPSTGAARWCKSCIRTLTLGTDYFDDHFRNGSKNGKELELPCCMGLCECRICTSDLAFEMQSNFYKKICEASIKEALHPSPFHYATKCIRKLHDTADFCLGTKYIELKSNFSPSTKYISRIKPRKMKKLQNIAMKQGRARKGAEKLPSKVFSCSLKDTPSEDKEDYSIFKPTCARADITNDAIPNGNEKSIDNFPSACSDMIRNMREHLRKSSTNKKINPDKDSDRISSGRAARANQRRLLKDVASFGSAAVSSLGLIDTLSNREPQLRFDRSSIHAWGVFADEDISADEMIIEYRGELIENAVAEKREKVYEAEKIGSDYMFRIDADIVCDATKQGNVARFINASCDPNCYTKIIPLDGTKRIVIYAKRDITAGEELCYDYKFPIEYDEKKRIPCHCGARECRGFMNWDKRYVAIAETKKSD